MSKEQLRAKEKYEGNGQQSITTETSMLFEPHAVWVLLFLLLVGIWHRFAPLIIESMFLLALFTIITMWKRLSLKHLTPTLHFSRSRLFAGEEFLIYASVHNDKWLPLVWLEWCFAEHGGISVGDSEGDINTIRFLWLLWFRKVKWTLTGKALQRGVHNIGQITLRSGDGFRFAETERSHVLDGKIYVYPKLMPVNIPNFRPSVQWGAKGKQGGLLEDLLQVIGIREYQAGDELRKLNWKASARTGKLQTNVYQPVVTEQLLIYIDVQGFVIDETAYEDTMKQQKYSSEEREAFEWFLSVIASVAVKYKEQGIRIGFAGNGLNCNGEKMPCILPAANFTLFLDQLALITQRLEVHGMSPLEKVLHKGRLSVPLYIFCRHITEGHYTWYQQHRHELSEVCFFYRDETEYVRKLASTARPMSTFLPPLNPSGGES